MRRNKRQSPSSGGLREPAEHTSMTYAFETSNHLWAAQLLFITFLITGICIDIDRSSSDNNLTNVELPSYFSDQSCQGESVLKGHVCTKVNLTWINSKEEIKSTRYRVAKAVTSREAGRHTYFFFSNFFQKPFVQSHFELLNSKNWTLSFLEIRPPPLPQASE